MMCIHIQDTVVSKFWFQKLKIVVNNKQATSSTVALTVHASNINKFFLNSDHSFLITVIVEIHQIMIV